MIKPLKWPTYQFPLRRTDDGRLAKRAPIETPLTEQLVMKKRLNVKFVIRLVLGTLVVGVTVGLLHMVQVQREAGALLGHAQQARTDGDSQEAREFYRRYLGYVPTDDEARGELALILCDLAEQPDATNRTRLIAMERMENVLQRDPNNSEVRRRLAHFESKIGRFIDAKEHAEYLLNDSPEDAELHLLLGRCHVAMEHEQEATVQLRKAIDLDKSLIEAYRLLIHLILRKSGGPSDEAEQVLDEMIAANPDSHMAYLARATYFAGAKKQEEASQAVEYALEKSPDDADVLHQAGWHALREEQLDEARKHLLRGVEIYPEEARFYRLLAVCERLDNQLPAAIAYLKQGVEALPESVDLLATLAEFQIESRDLEATKSTIQKLGKLNADPNVFDLLTARVRAGDGKWVEARQILESLRPRVVRDQALSRGVNLILGECYGRLSQPELQIEAFRRALSLRPNPLEAKKANMGLAAAYQALGQPDDARRHMAQAAQDGDLTIMLKIISLDMSRVLALPKERRNWARIERMLKQVEEAIDEDVPQEFRAQLTAWDAEVLFQKDDPDAAFELLATQRAQHPEIAVYWLAAAQLEARRERIEQALALLDEAESHLPDKRLPVALTRANIYQIAGDEDSRERLEALARRGDGLTAEEQLTLLHKAATVFRAAGDIDKAKELYRTILEARQDDERALLLLFEVAIQADDDSASQQAIDRIEEAIGSDSFAWQFAMGLYSLHSARSSPDQRDDLLSAAQGHVDKAERLRSGLAQLIGLQAEIDDMRGNTDDAIEGYLRAIERGATPIGHFRRLVALLMQRGRSGEIDRLIERMPALVKAAGLEAFATGRIVQSRGAEDAEKYVRQSYDENAKDFRVHVLFGSVMARGGKLDEAERAFRRAIEVGSDQTGAWIALVDFLVKLRKVDQAREAMEQATQALPEETAMVTRARCYELLGDQTTAERLFLQALEARRDDLVVIASVADYFNRSKQPEQAKTYMRRILEIGSPDPQDELPVLAVARRGLAELITRDASYQDHLAALKLIDENTRGDGSLGPEDFWMKGQILARRRDGTSRREAIRIINQSLAMRPSNAQARFILSQLYSAEGEHTQARDHLTRLCVENPQNPTYKALLINVLLTSGAVGEAADWLRTLEKQNPNAAETADATARVRVKQGRIDEAIAAITSLIPPSPIPVNQLPLLRQVASALNSLAPLAESDEQHEQIINVGHELLRQYVDADPKSVLTLADYLSRNGKLDEALERCQQAISAGIAIELIAGVGVSAIRSARDAAEPSHRELVEGWLQSALKDRPGYAPLLLQMAELQDMKEDYDASEDYYRRVLSLSDINYLRRAQALNNLSFLLALRGKNNDEALKMIDEAINLAGPLSDMLDTRAIVLLAGGAVESAISDLRQAASDAPSGLKYFHLAHAYLLAKDREAAAEALSKAHQEGLTSDEISPLERPSYRKLLDAVGQGSAD